MDMAQIKAAMTKAGLKRQARDIDIIALPAIRLITTPKEEASIQVGESRLGGLPDLPADIQWPQWKGIPQTFIVQLRLEEIQSCKAARLLPSKGMLWFFYDSKQETYGEKPEDQGGWQVLYRAEVTKLQRVTAPKALPEKSIIPACSIQFSDEWTLPQEPPVEKPDLKWSDDDVEQYENILADHPGENENDKKLPRHHLLGYPDTLQDDMRLQCAMMVNGITSSSDPRVDELDKHSHDWHLLLQIDTDERIGMRWGSMGMLYYWINEADLQAANFDKTWLVLQSE